MALYERLMGQGPSPTIPVHQFSAIMAEFARGRVTGAQAQVAVAEVSDGVPLDAGEVAEAQALLATISGSATAKLARAKEIDDVLMLGGLTTAYGTASLVKTRLGV